MNHPRWKWMLAAGAGVLWIIGLLDQTWDTGMTAKYIGISALMTTIIMLR